MSFARVRCDGVSQTRSAIPMTHPTELRIPVGTIAATVLDAEGWEFSGLLFVSEQAVAHTGPMRPEERMNDPSDFFPFQVEGQSTPVLLNKHRVSVITVRAPEPDIEQALPHRRVVMVCDGRDYAGVISLATPSTQCRVLDHLNGADRFLVLRSERWQHLLNKWRISRVVEVEP